MVSFSILLKYDVPNCVFSTNSSDRFVFFMSSLLTIHQIKDVKLFYHPCHHLHE